MDFEIPSYLKACLVIYSVLTFFSIILIIRNRVFYNLFTTEYWRFIFTPVKFAIFFAGTLALVLPVSYLGIDSWDYPIAIFQPILSYLTAPWAVAAIYRYVKGKAKPGELYLAVCMMLFAGSWSVEIYILLRDGVYMPEWLFNIPVGILCYSAVGLLWNVEWSDGRGSFAFMKENE